MADNASRRSRLRRAAPIFLLSVVAAIVLCSAYAYRLTRGGLGPERGTVAIGGLSAPVKVLRDAAGIPHIYAHNRLDLARALGYVEAQDRLFQTEMRGRLATGRLAEVFGPDLVESDYAYRILDPERFARESLAMYPPAMRAELDAFVDGRNAWIEQHRDDLPLAFRILGIKPLHASALDLEAGSLPIAMLLAYNATEESLYLNLAQRFSPDTIAGLLPVYPTMPLEPPPKAITAALGGTLLSFRLAPAFGQPGHPGVAASNNWVVDGAKSVSGKPMLANDPHLPQSLPSIWYEAVLVTPDGFTAGALAAGGMTVAIGTNGRVAWGVTSVQPDVIDLSVEKLSADGNSYLYQDKWYPLSRREVTIKVAGAPAVNRVVSSTRHGPLVSEVLSVPDNPLNGVAVRRSYALALRFAGLVPMPVERSGIEAAQARNGKELVEAYRNFAITPLNLVWADADGNVGWHVVGAIPNRHGFDGKYPTPGWTGEFEWNGTIPYDELPHAENPPGHFIVTANQHLADVPYNGSWAAPFRTDRITALIRNRGKLALDDFRAIQNDRVSLYALKLKDVLLEAGDGGDPDLAWALGELRGFDGAMTADS
ncbi:MAG: penicillin acylase family protein, partial [Candidatus Binataceae bacterium]